MIWIKSTHKIKHGEQRKRIRFALFPTDFDTSWIEGTNGGYYKRVIWLQKYYSTYWYNTATKRWHLQYRELPEAALSSAKKVLDKVNRLK